MDSARSMRRATWLRHLHQWHWISAALCLLAMLLFSFTGITLNHAGQIEGRPVVENRQTSLPSPLLDELRRMTVAQDGNSAPLPPAARAWLNNTLVLRLHLQPAEWSAEEIYLSLPRPGGDAWLRIALEDGSVEYEHTDRGWISWLNDLHKGRNTGPAWGWFIDIFAAACLVFSLTGLLILKFHAANRPSTWPVVGLGVVIPVLLALLFIH